MELTVDREDRIYTNMPDSLSRRFKPHKNQLTPGVGLIRQIGQENPGGVQAKGNDGVISQNQRNSFYNFPRGRNKAYCVQPHHRNPDFRKFLQNSGGDSQLHFLRLQTERTPGFQLDPEAGGKAERCRHGLPERFLRPDR